MTVEHFADLIRTLIREEARTLGVPESAFAAYENTFTPDGGIDAEVSVAPSLPGPYLPTKPVIAQFKKGTLTKAAARNEIKNHPRVRELVRKGYAYRLVLGSDEDRGTLDDLKETLVTELSRAGAPAPIDVEVLSGLHLADWIAEYPALTGHVAFLAAGEPPLIHWLTYPRWQRLGHETVWRGDEGRNEEVARLVAKLGSPRAVVRVIGPPGAGKTRFVLEAISRANAADRTLYGPEYRPELADVLRSGGSVERRKAILVVDECTSEQATQLEAFRHPAADVRLITIGTSEDIYARSSDPRVLVLQPLGPKDAEHVAEDRLDPGTKEFAPTIALRSNGYPKLIVLLCEALSEAPDALSALSVGQHERLVDVLKKLLGSAGKGEPVQALCLPRQFGFAGAAAAEQEALAVGTHQNLAELKRAIDELGRRSLIGRAADFAYVTPILLAEWLAGDLWKVRGAQLFLSLQEANLSPRGLRSTLRRLIDLGLVAETAEVARGLLESPKLFRDVSDLDDGDRASFVDELATINPGEAGKLLGRLLRSETRERLLTLETGRRHVVWALQKCAWAAESFEVAASVLLRLSAAEVEQWGNNATGVLRSLFLTHLGATEAPGNVRLRWIRSAWSQAASDERKLLLSVARRALEEEVSGEASPFPEIVQRPERWMPRDRGEERDYKRGFAELVATGLSDPSDELRKEAETVAAFSVRSLLTRGFGDIAVELVASMGEGARSAAELARAILQIKNYDLKGFSPESKEAFQQIEALAAPKSTRERLLRALRIPAWEVEEGAADHPDFAQLAQSFVANSPGPYPWDVIEGSDPQRLFEFGQALAKTDPSRLLLSELESRSSEPVFLRLLAAYVPSLPPDPSSGDGQDLLDAWATDASKSRAVLEATWLAEPSPRAAQRLMTLLKLGAIPEQEFLRLRAGGWLLRVPVEDALGVLSGLKNATVAFHLVFQLWHHSKPPHPRVVSLCEEIWLRLQPADIASNDLAWEWQTFGREIVERVPELVAKAGLAFFATGDYFRMERDAGPLVAGAMRKAPGVVFPQIASALLSEAESAYAFRVAAGLAGKLDDEKCIEVVLQWARTGERERKAAAKLMGKPASAGATNLANALLEAFPADPDVMREASRRYFGGSFWGPAAEHYRNLRESLEGMRSNAGPGLLAWVEAAIAQSDYYLASGRQMDETHEVDS
jgi:hypothetical protein